MLLQRLLILKCLSAIPYKTIIGSRRDGDRYFELMEIGQVNKSRVTWRDRRVNKYNYLICTPEITVQEMLNWHLRKAGLDGYELNSRRTCLVKDITNNYYLNISCGNSLIQEQEQEEDRSNCAKLFNSANRYPNTWHVSL